MSSIEARVAAVEREVVDLRSDLKLSLASTNRMVKALVLQVGQLTTTVAGHTATFADHGERLARIEHTQSEHTVGIQLIVRMLDTLIERSDEA